MWLKDIFKINEFKDQIHALQQENASLSSKLETLEGENFFSLQGKVTDLTNCYDQRVQEFHTLSAQIKDNFEKKQDLDKQISSALHDLTRMKEMYNSINSAIKNYTDLSFEYEHCKLPDKYLEACEQLAPSIRLSIPNMNTKELHQAYLEKEQLITDLFKQYTDSSQTETALYELTILALKAEVQNVLYSIKASENNVSADVIKNICQKYLKIVCDANQALAGTYTKFIGSLEYHLIDLFLLESQYCQKR